MLLKELGDLFGFSSQRWSACDEDAMKLVDDGFVDEHGGDERVNAVREHRNYMTFVDFLAQFCDYIVEELSYSLDRRGVHDSGSEVEKGVAAVRCMHDFGIELGPVEFAQLRRR